MEPTQKPTPWTNYCPKDYVHIVRMLRDLGIIVPPPMERMPEPKRPVRLENMRNRILVEKSRLREAPVGYRTYAYMDDSGNWSGICTSPCDVFAVCRGLGIACELDDGKFRMPDYLAGVRVDPERIRKTIDLASDADARAGRSIETGESRRTRVAGRIAYLCGSLSGNRHEGSTSEEILMARYAKMLLLEACRRPIGDWPGFPEEYARMHEYICKYNNQWTMEHMGEVECERYTQDQELKPDSDGIWTLLTKVNRPDFCREPENTNKKTFDFVEMRFGLRSKDALDDRSKLVRTYLRDFIKIGFQKIKESRQFRQYGVPIQFLRATKYGITDQDELVVTYEIRTKARHEDKRKTET